MKNYSKLMVTDKQYDLIQKLSFETDNVFGVVIEALIISNWDYDKAKEIIQAVKEDVFSHTMKLDTGISEKVCRLVLIETNWNYPEAYEKLNKVRLDKIRSLHKETGKFPIECRRALVLSNENYDDAKNLLLNTKSVSSEDDSHYVSEPIVDNSENGIVRVFDKAKDGDWTL